MSYEHLDLGEKRALLEQFTGQYWDVQQQLGAITVARATLMNEIQAEQSLPAPVPGQPQ